MLSGSPPATTTVRVRGTWIRRLQDPHEAESVIVELNEIEHVVRTRCEVSAVRRASAGRTCASQYPTATTPNSACSCSSAGRNGPAMSDMATSPPTITPALPFFDLFVQNAAPMR